MDKIICDICGTEYPENMENCPICGCSREYSLDTIDADIMPDTAARAEKNTPKKNKEIFDYDEVNQERIDRSEIEEDDFEEEEDEEESGTNVFLVVVLVVLIALLLLTAGFFFVRYFLPNMVDQPAETESIATTASVETEPTETEDPGIPCTNLSVPGGKIELGKNGLWLMNVHVYPENTTDALTYVSEDETIATVSADGTVTAVGEGQTVIVVACGEQQIRCKVTVDYSVDAGTVPEGEIPAVQVGEETEPEATDAAAATESTDNNENTEETQAEEPQQTEAATEETAAEDLELKLKQNDISIYGRYYSVELELDCDIKPEEIYWFTMDSTIAIVNNGIVTSTGSGMTRIYGEYEGQQVSCLIRCIF